MLLGSLPDRSILCPAPLYSTGAACSQGRLLPGAACGPPRCGCFRLRVRSRLIRLRRLRLVVSILRCRLFPGCLPINPFFLPPSPWDLCPRLSLCHLTYSQNRSRRNKLRDRILPPKDRRPDPQDPRFLHCSRQGWVEPPPISPTARLPPC